MANVRTSIASIEPYKADNVPHGHYDPDRATSTTDSGYSGMTIALLGHNYDMNLLHQHLKARPCLTNELLRAEHRRRPDGVQELTRGASRLRPLLSVLTV